MFFKAPEKRKVTVNKRSNNIPTMLGIDKYRKELLMEACELASQSCISENGTEVTVDVKQAMLTMIKTMGKTTIEEALYVGYFLGRTLDRVNNEVLMQVSVAEMAKLGEEEIAKGKKKKSQLVKATMGKTIN